MPLNLASFPVYLFQASQERAWLPSAIDFSQEAGDWASLSDDENLMLSRLIAGFRVGELGVTHELAPLAAVLRDERRLDEEMYITVQTFEEARHVEFFERWLAAALPGVWGRELPYPEVRGDLYGGQLPAVMRTLHEDRSPEAQLRAVLMYHFYIEGIGAESGYPLFHAILEKSGRFPALAQGIRLIQRDEARHIAFGTYKLQQLLEEHAELQDAFDAEMVVIEGSLEEASQEPFRPFEDRPVPFGLNRSDFDGLYRQHYELQRRNVVSRRQPVGV